MRLFIASNFSNAAIGAIEVAVARVKPRVPKASWLKPEAYHLTYAFLGEHPESVVEPLRAALERRLADASAVVARIGIPGFFPNEKRPRVGWLAVEPNDSLQAIAREVRAAVRDAAVAFDEKPFVAHLTLVRMREPWNRRETEAFNAEFAKLRAPESRIEAVTLYSSELGAGGAVHTPVASLHLRV